MPIMEVPPDISVRSNFCQCHKDYRDRSQRDHKALMIMFTLCNKNPVQGDIAAFSVLTNRREEKTKGNIFLY